MILKSSIGTFTDDTHSVGEGVTFVKTAQNIKYFDGKSVSTTTRVLIKELGLERLKVIGITGTNGKTTTAAGIYSCLLDLDKKVAMQGTRGFFVNEQRVSEYSLTTPSILETIAHMLQAKEAGCEYFVMEVSSHAIAQNRIENLPFALKIHTNVTSDHLDYHGSLAQYRAVKQSFFSDATPKLVNKDENFQINLAGAQSYGVENAATFKVRAYKLSDGIEAVFTHFDKPFTFYSPLRGSFNLYNLMAIIGAVKMLTGASLDKICQVIEYFGGVSGRMEVVSTQPLVIVDFAHTHDGISKVIESFGGQDVVVVFGAGGNRDKSKRPLMGKAASGAKRIYLTSDNPRDEEPQSIIDAVLEGIENKDKVCVEVDRAKAIESALKQLQGGEVLLILGKGDETTQEIAGVKHPFDDRQVV
ncbi:MAG: UDP-N-acetylmuramoyl-L-alanyl-D-glutamate--2,6-diaminopimelate ligase, partial [Campylobacterota bacterium]